MAIPAAMLSGGQGGIDLSGGPATSGADSYSGGAVFNFAPPPGVQQAQSTNNTVAIVAVVALVLWLLTRK